MQVLATSLPPPKPTGVWQNLEKRVRARHTVVRELRELRLQTLKKDIERLARDDVSFVKSFIEERFPVDIEVNEKFLENLPFKVRSKDKMNDTSDLADTLD